MERVTSQSDHASEPVAIHLSIQLRLNLNKAGLRENLAEIWAAKEYFNPALDRDMYYVYKSRVAVRARSFPAVATDRK